MADKKSKIIASLDETMDATAGAFDGMGEGLELKAPTPEEQVAILNQTKEILKSFGRPVERPNVKKISLYLDGDLNDYVRFRCTKPKQAVTQYINSLVRADMEAYLAAGGNADEWTDKE